MYVNAATKSAALQSYLWHDIYNIVF